MELPNLGEYCSLKSCGKLDYLPFFCRGCNKYYCGDHRFPEHLCVVKRKVERKPDINMKKLLYKCSVKGCKRDFLVEYRCSECDLLTCMHHRHHLVHSKLKKKKPKNLKKSCRLVINKNEKQEDSDKGSEVY